MNRTARLLPLVLCAAVAACGDGAPEDGAEVVLTDSAAADAAGGELQSLIELPADFAPEGIAVGEGTTFYVGSLAEPTAGQILVGDLSTGEYRELVAPTGVTALGLKHDSQNGLLYVAGGASGMAHVYDASTGAEVATIELTEQGSTINDVELTADAAYFTNSQAPELYRVARDAQGRPGEVTTISLPPVFGEAGGCEGLPAVGGNGLVATPDGRHLIVIHMSEGRLYRIDTTSGEVTPVELSGGDLCSADGLALDGSTLYAVQNFMNQVAVVEMGGDFLTGTVERHITEPFASNPATKIPTTIADAGDALYAVTAGFADPAPDYVVRIEK